MDPFSDTQVAVEKGEIEDEQVVLVLDLLKKALQKDLEDEDQTKLVEAIQQNRTFLLKYAMQAYLKNPKNGELLGGVTSLIGQMEKTVREDRKEKQKKKDVESNVVSFNQMLDAMKSISAGAISVPVFDTSFFVLDPSKSLVTGLDIKPISKDELTEGNAIVDLDGKEI